MELNVEPNWLKCAELLMKTGLRCVITPSDREKHLLTHFQKNNLFNTDFFFFLQQFALYA